MKQIFFLSLVLLISIRVSAQHKIEGIVKDSTGKSLSFVTISLMDQHKVLKGYSMSDNNGHFILTVPNGLPLNELFLNAAIVGYKKTITTLQSDKDNYRVIMQPESRDLAPVVIKGERSKLKVNGDTLSYDVRAFSNPNDRVIEDVIKKMPGIIVDDKGKISYNGKNITNFYLDGDNLLDDKYAIGTKNISNQIVDKVQILDNHQPIKALQGKAVTDEVDINITFRDSAKLKPISQASIGAGLPGNYDMMLNTMLFKGKYKSINYFKTNNIGTDLIEEVTSFNLEDMQKRLEVTPPEKLLSISTISNPDLPVYRYLFNNTGMFNFNNLITLKPDVKLKANIYYLYDRQRQTYQSNTMVYLPGDTVKYSTQQTNNTNPNLLHAQLNLNINKNNYYLNDSFTADVNQQNATSVLNTNGTPVAQELGDKLRNFSNELNYIGTKSNRTFELYNFINYISQPQLLSIEPGLNADYFNGGVSFSTLSQSARIPTLFTNTYLTFRIATGRFRQAYKIGVNTSSENLQSALTQTSYNGTINLINDSAVNSLHLLRTKAFTEGNFSWVNDRLTVNFNLPLNYQHIVYGDNHYQYIGRLNNLLFNPSASIKLLSGTENNITFNYRYTTDFGGINDIYRGYILANYRSLYFNDAPLYRSNTHLVGLGYNYRRSIQLLFISLNAFYSSKTVNNLPSLIIDNNFQRQVFIPVGNTIDNVQITFIVSKYLFKLNTSVSFKASWQLSQFNQFENGSLLKFNNYTTLLSLATSSKLNERLYFNYNVIYTQQESVQNSASITSGATQKTNQIRQKSELNFLTLKNLNLKFAGENYYNQQNFFKTTDYFFLDATLQYKFIRYKIDLEASVLNIANIQNFNTTTVFSNTTTINNYAIRGRIGMIKILFNF